MPKADIKVIIFDLGNVLLNYDAKKAAQRFSKVSGVPLVQLWAHFFISKTEKAYTRGEMTSRAFYQHAKRSLKFDISYKDFAYYWNDIFVENRGMDQLLRKLKKNYPLYLISNTNKLHYEYIKKNFRILRHFTRKFPSHEVGLRKPDAKIYKRVLKSIRRKPEDCIFIDDTPAFVRGAKQVGIHAIRFKTKGELVQNLKKLGVSI